jgi:CheY-like chemotaxis protein
MHSYATSATFGATPRNFAHLLGHKLDSRPNSNDIPIVFLMTEDISEQGILRSLISRDGWRLETFESTREFLARARPLVPSCLILCLALPDPNALQEQKQIARERAEVPIIVISSCGARDVRRSGASPSRMAPASVIRGAVANARQK